MFEQTTIDAFMPLLGWRQNFISSGTQLTRLTTSESGRFYNDASSFLTFANLEAIAPHFSNIFSQNQIQINEGLTNWLEEKTRAFIYEGLSNWSAEYGKKYTCDLDDFVIKHKKHFVDILYYKVAIKMLQVIAENADLQVNRLTNNVKSSDIYFVLVGDTQGNKSKLTLENQYNNALKTFCIPRKQKGVRQSTV